MNPEELKWKTPGVEDRTDLRKDIFAAIDLYKFLTEHHQNTDVLQLNIADEIHQAKRDCFEIMFISIGLLRLEE